MVAVDSSPELLEQARLRAADFPDVTFVEGDGTRLDVLPGTFDIAGCSRTLHHVRRPELFVAELSRVTRPSGSVLVIDQIAPGDPLVAVELDRFERARDPSHTRLLPDVDVRSLLEANGLVVQRTQFVEEQRDLDHVPRPRRAARASRASGRAALAPQRHVARRRLVSRLEVRPSVT